MDTSSLDLDDEHSSPYQTSTEASEPQLFLSQIVAHGLVLAARHQPVDRASDVSVPAQSTVRNSNTLIHVVLLTFYLDRWRLHLLFISRPPKQVNLRFPCCFLVNPETLKEPRSENNLSSRRIDLKPFKRRSKTGLKELSNNSCATRISLWLVFIIYMPAGVVTNPF
jgi:hypothetical protein